MSRAWTWKQKGADCHFFVREARGIQSQPITLGISAAERAKAKRGDYSWLLDHYALLPPGRVG